MYKDLNNTSTSIDKASNSLDTDDAEVKFR